MIESELELKQSIEQLERMYRMLLEFRRRIAPLNYKNYQSSPKGRSKKFAAFNVISMSN
jgi:hypothetical protein